MLGLSSSEMIFYGGIAVMAAALAGSILCSILFHTAGRKLEQKLEQEYGKPFT